MECQICGKAGASSSMRYGAHACPACTAFYHYWKNKPIECSETFFWGACCADSCAYHRMLRYLAAKEQNGTISDLERIILLNPPTELIVPAPSNSLLPVIKENSRTSKPQTSQNEPPERRKMKHNK